MRIQRLLRLVALPLFFLIAAVSWYSVQLNTVGVQRADLDKRQQERNGRIQKEEAAKSAERSRALDLLAKCVFLIEQIKQDTEYAEPESEGKADVHARQFDREKRELFLQHFEDELRIWCLDFKPDFKTKNLNNINNLVAIHNELQKKYAFSADERIEASVKLRNEFAVAAGVPPLPKEEQERQDLLADAREALAAEDYDLAEHYLRQFEALNGLSDELHLSIAALKKDIDTGRESKDVPLRQFMINQHKAVTAAMDTMLELKSNGRLQCPMLSECFGKSVPRDVWFYDYAVVSAPPHKAGNTRFEVKLKVFFLSNSPMALCKKPTDFVLNLMQQFGYEETERLLKRGETQFKPGFNRRIGALFDYPALTESQFMKIPLPSTLTQNERMSLPKRLPTGMDVSYTLSFEIPAETSGDAKR